MSGVVFAIIQARAHGFSPFGFDATVNTLLHRNGKTGRLAIVLQNFATRLQWRRFLGR